VKNKFNVADMVKRVPWASSTEIDATTPVPGIITEKRQYSEDFWAYKVTWFYHNGNHTSEWEVEAGLDRYKQNGDAK
jgi:hypothetical protein